MDEEQQVVEDPSVLAREIKGLLLGFKESLKKSAPWDREVEFQRNNLRHKIVHLIFAFPYSPQALAVDSPLWLDTSYALISNYRQRLTALDGPTPSGPGPRPKHNKPPFVETRKLQQRFRSFLQAEDKFWKAFVLRVVNTYGLDEAKPALMSLDIINPDPVNRTANMARDHPLAPASPPKSQTPPEVEHPPPGQREKKLLLVHKVLICLGDLARYREQYNEAGGRPKGGHLTHSPAERGRGKRGGRGGTGTAGRRGPAELPPRERDYSKAAECYQQARLLIPDNGNPSNQLAVLAIWSSDSFSSVYHCYRALFVKQPFITARSNLEKSLKKTMEDHRRNLAADAGATDAASLTETFKENVLFLHALWAHRPGSSSIEKHASKIITAMKGLISSRTLTADVITKTVVLALGALWNVRLFVPSTSEPAREQGSSQNKTPTKAKKSSNENASGPQASESLIMLHVLDVCRILMEVGLEELSSNGEVVLAPDHSNQDHVDLAQYITATFRRTLPALRIASKFLKGNIDYVQRSTSSGLSEPQAKNVTLFWATYSRFANALVSNFPLTRLPVLSDPLEEDLDIKGFLPVKDGMFQATDSGPAGTPASQPLAQVHPNEEQLMRIADLIVDANLVALSQESVMSVHQGILYVGDVLPSSSEPQPGAARTSVTPEAPRAPSGLPHHPIEEEEDDMYENAAASDGASMHPVAGDLDHDLEMFEQRRRGTTSVDDDAATESTEDPVNLAMNASLSIGDDEETDEDEEMILYPVMPAKIPNRFSPSAPKPPVQASDDTVIAASAAVQDTHLATTLPSAPAAATPEKPMEPLAEMMSRLAVAAPMTAQDLLARAMEGGPAPSAYPTSSPLAQPISIRQTPIVNRVGPVKRLSEDRGSPLHQRGSSIDRQSHITTSPPLLFGGSGSVWAPTQGSTPQSSQFSTHTGYPYHLGEGAPTQPPSSAWRGSVPSSGVGTYPSPILPKVPMGDALEPSSTQNMLNLAASHTGYAYPTASVIPPSNSSNFNPAPGGASYGVHPAQRRLSMSPGTGSNPLPTHRQRSPPTAYYQSPYQSLASSPPFQQYHYDYKTPLKQGAIIGDGSTRNVMHQAWG